MTRTYESFRGTIIAIQDGTDGSTITLENEQGDMIKSTISIPNLGPDSDFDFSHLKAGNKLWVSGDTFMLGDEKYLTAEYATTVYADSERTLCESKGGSYEANGMAQIFMCDMPATDAGIACTDSNDCEGLCFSENGTGTCSPTTINFGCIPILEDGEEVTICID